MQYININYYSIDIYFIKIYIHCLESLSISQNKINYCQNDNNTNLNAIDGLVNK